MKKCIVQIEDNIVLHFQIKATAANPGSLTSFGFVLSVLAYFPDDLYIPNI